MVKLSKFAKLTGLSYKTAYNRFVRGDIKGVKIGSGNNCTILVDENQIGLDEFLKGGPELDLPEHKKLDLPITHSVYDNLETCVKISKYLIFNEMDKDHPDNQTIVNGLRTLLQSTRYMIDFDIDDEEAENQNLGQQPVEEE